MKDVSNRHNEVQFLEGRGVTSDSVTALIHIYVSFGEGVVL
jgi:hypothetical protein